MMVCDLDPLKQAILNQESFLLYEAMSHTANRGILDLD